MIIRSITCAAAITIIFFVSGCTSGPQMSRLKDSIAETNATSQLAQSTTSEALDKSTKASNISNTVSNTATQINAQLNETDKRTEAAMQTIETNNKKITDLFK